MFHDFVYIFGCIFYLIEFCHSSCEILHGLCGIASFQSLVGPMESWKGEKKKLCYKESWLYFISLVKVMLKILVIWVTQIYYKNKLFVFLRTHCSHLVKQQAKLWKLYSTAYYILP